MSFTPGQQYRLLRDFGNQAYDPIGGVRHGLPAGSVGTVVIEVAAAEQGAHNSEEDAYVLEFEDQTRTIGTDGVMVVGPTARRVSFAVMDFDQANPDRLFEPVA